MNYVKYAEASKREQTIIKSRYIAMQNKECWLCSSVGDELILNDANSAIDYDTRTDMIRGVLCLKHKIEIDGITKKLIADSYINNRDGYYCPPFLKQRHIEWLNDVERREIFKVYRDLNKCKTHPKNCKCALCEDFKTHGILYGKVI